MKRFIFFYAFLLLSFLNSNAQLNPVNNLQFTHGYVMPYNCYSLSWSEPDPSVNDTLVGYNIYRDNTLYEFTTEREHSCDPCMGMPQTPFCDFMNYMSGWFFIHVTAVYNTAHLESGYIDSVNFGGIAIGFDEPARKETLGIRAIRQSAATVMVELNKPADQGEIQVSDVMGQTIGTAVFKNQQSISLPVMQFYPGIFLVKVSTKTETILSKVLLK